MASVRPSCNASCNAVPCASTSIAPPCIGPRHCALACNAPVSVRGTAAGSSGTSSASCGASSVATTTSSAAPRLALPLACSLAEPASSAMFTLRTASRVTVPAAVPESATPARRLAGASAMSTPARHAGVSTPVAATCASSAPAGNAPKRAGSKRLAVASSTNARSPESPTRPRPASSLPAAVRRNRSTSTVSSSTLAAKFERDAAGDGAIRDVAADLLTVAVEVGSDRSGEPCCHQRRIDRLQVDIGDRERPRARAGLRRAESGPCRWHGRRPRTPPRDRRARSRPRATKSASTAGAAESGRRRACRPADWTPRRCRLIPPPLTGCARATMSRRVAGSVLSHAARSNSEASTATATSGTSASGASVACAVNRAPPASPLPSTSSAASEPDSASVALAPLPAASPVSARRPSIGKGGFAPMAAPPASVHDSVPSLTLVTRLPAAPPA